VRGIVSRGYDGQVRVRDAKSDEIEQRPPSGACTRVALESLRLPVYP
jgi:hypothetical protein